MSKQKPASFLLRVFPNKSPERALIWILSVSGVGDGGVVPGQSDKRCYGNSQGLAVVLVTGLHQAVDRPAGQHHQSCKQERLSASGRAT